MDDQSQTEAGGSRVKLWLKRLGVAGFLFFLIKGLVWLGVFFFVGRSCTDQAWF